MHSAPPARAISASPSISAWTAETMACAPDPHSRFTFIAGVVSGIPACIAITRDRYMSRGSVLITWPMTTCPIWPPSTPARDKAARAAWVAISIGGNPASAPPKLPMAVRAAERMWMSVMGSPFRLWRILA